MEKTKLMPFWWSAFFLIGGFFEVFGHNHWDDLLCYVGIFFIILSLLIFKGFTEKNMFA